MNDLSIPADLLPITEQDGRAVTSMRALHEFLEVSRDFTNWAKQMFEYGFTEHEDYAEVYANSGENLSGGRPRRDWAITLDMGKELSMIQRTERGKQARQYFIEAEKRAKTAPALTGPALLAAALIEAQATLESHRQQVLQLEPRAQAWDSFLGSNGDYSVNEAAKVLSRDKNIHIGEGRLRALLEEWRWIYRHSGKPRAMQTQIETGRLAEKASFYYHPETGEKIAKTPQVRVTPKGIDAITKRMIEVAA